MANLASLIVKIGARDEEIQQALEKLGVKAKATDAELKKLGNSDIAQQARKSFDELQQSMKGITDAQQRLAQKATDTARGLSAMGQALGVTNAATRLTKTELDQMARSVERGLDAFRALGQQAPAELQKVANQLKQQQQALAQSSGAGAGDSSFLSSLGGKLAAVAGPAAIGAAVKSVVDLADGLKRMSDQTGIGVEQLQQLSFAAGQSGNTLDQITSAISQMENRLSSGDTSAIAALKALRLNFSQLRAESPDRQFIDIGEAIAKVADPLERTQLAMDLFGKSGTQILPTLTGGLRDLTGQANAAGQVLDKEMVERLDRLGDEFGTVTTAGKNFIATVLDGIIQSAAKAGKALVDLGNHLPKGSVSAGQSNGRLARTETVTIAPGFDGSLPVTAQQGRNAVDMFADIKRGLGNLEDVNFVVEELAKKRPAQQ
jgi:hypothetical protein